MKILVLTGGYLPAQRYGGPVASLVNFTEHLGDDYAIDILCRNHDLHDPTPFPNLQEGFHPLGKAQVCYLPDHLLNKATYKAILAERRPDCLYLSSIFDAGLNVPLLSLARKNHIPVVYAPRGELNPAVLAMKGLKKKLFLLAMRLSGLYRNVVFQASSEEERQMILKALKVRAEQVVTAPNLPAAPTKSCRSGKCPGSLRVIFLARLHRSKNLAYAIERVKELGGNVIFDIYGPVEHPDYWADCQRLMSDTPEKIRIRYCGAVPVGKAGETFAQYDCFLFPTISENYGQVIAEAVQAGTLPVISRGTTPWDDLRGGAAIPLSEPEEFVRTLDELCAMDEAEFSAKREELRQYAEKKLDTKQLIAQTKALFAAATEGGIP